MSGITSAATSSRYVHPGFPWEASDVYLFDIDGTLVNCRDAVQYTAFASAVQNAFGLKPKLDGLVFHGNTDPGILRAALQREGLDEKRIDSMLPKLIQLMCEEVERNRQHLRPELCPGIQELLSRLQRNGKLLGVASGNLEPIGWAKLERAGVRSMFQFGSFAWPRQSRTEIFQHGAALAQQRLNANASSCVIGDTPADVQAAAAAGLKIIALATGIYSFSDLMACNPDACFGSAVSLLEP